MRTPIQVLYTILWRIFKKKAKKATSVRLYQYRVVELQTIHGIQTFLAKMTIFFEYSNILLVVIFEL